MRHRNFIIVGTQRTGSSALGESLGLVSKIACGREWATKLPWREKVKATTKGLQADFSQLTQADQNFMGEAYNSSKIWLGCRLLFSSSNKWIFHPRFSLALFHERFEEYIAWIKKKPDIHIIHICRRDNLDWLKSIYLAKHTKLYSKKLYPSGIKIEILVRTAISRVRSKMWVDFRLATLANSKPYFRVEYQDLLFDQDNVVRETSRFLGLENIELHQEKRRLQKQSSECAKDYIKNYEELKRRLGKMKLLIDSFG